MKKRTFCLAMAAVMVFGLTGCGGAQTKGEAATTAESLSLIHISAGPVRSVYRDQRNLVHPV